jgi:hypothetical protein
MPSFTKLTLVGNTAAPSPGTASRWIPLNQYSQPFNVSFGVDVSVGESLEQWSVQHTFDDVFDSSVTPVVFTHSDATAVKADTDGNYAFPVAAIRIALTSASAGSSGNAVFWVRQAGL